MFKELFLESKINEGVTREIKELETILKLLLDHGYIQIGRKKFTKITGYASNYFGDIIGIKLGPGVSSAQAALNAPIRNENFVFTGKPEFSSTFENLVDEFISGPYKFNRKYKGSNYIFDFEYAEKVRAANPEVKFSNWYKNNYDYEAPKITGVRQKSITFKWFGSTMRGYPRGLSHFFSDYDIKTTSQTSGDGIGDWYGVMNIKTDKQKEFYDMLKEFGF
jgi:hypothetical protein